jgi:methyl-accepting chemotaxis protein
MKKILVRIFLSFGLVPAIILAVALTYAFTVEVSQALYESSQQSLTAIRTTKQAEIESYLRTLKSQVRSYSQNRMIIDAAKQFDRAFHSYAFEVEVDEALQKQRLESFYRNEFQQQYSALNNGKRFDVDSKIALFRPETIALQDAYISNNNYPLGEKDKLTNTGDHSFYDQLHGLYHPSIHNYLDEFGYYDIFIADLDEGNIIYSVFKELDFATSLKTGPYAKSGIAEAFNQAAAASDDSAVAVVDFKSYTPSYEGAAAFIASPIFDGETKVAVLIFQLPIERLNNIMSYDQKWQQVGMGDSGETYLVGPDKLMRSQGRFIIEDKNAYYDAITQSGMSESIIRDIKTRETTIGLHPVNTPAVTAGLEGKAGFATFPDYRGVSVHSSYAPINVEGFPWVIVSEIDEAEANAPTAGIVQLGIITGAVVLVVIAVFTLVVAAKYADHFLKPLYYVVGSLTYIAKDIEAGKLDLTRPLDPPGNNTLAKNMAKGINSVLARFAEVLRQLGVMTESMAAASAQVAQLSTESSKNMTQQESETVQIASAINELSATSAEVTVHATSGAEATKVVDDDTNAGAQTALSTEETIQELTSNLVNTSEVINSLENDSDNISTVLTVIQGIAEQTNLLALNAAIEAARAGDQGRGFAVVADEVRTLASRTQHSTEEIRAIIDKLQTQSKRAVKAMEQGCELANAGLEKAQHTGEALKSIAKQVSDIDSMNTMIANAAGEQSSVAEEVNKNVNQISHLTQQTSSEVSQTSTAAQQLLTLSEDLQALVKQFKV